MFASAGCLYQASRMVKWRERECEQASGLIVGGNPVFSVSSINVRREG